MVGPPSVDGHLVKPKNEASETGSSRPRDERWIEGGGAAGKDTADIAVINTPGGPVIVTVLVSQFSGDTAFKADKVMSKIGRAIYDFYAGEE